MLPIAQWCLPFFRQQSGRLLWFEAANTGRISSQPNSTATRLAITRRIKDECNSIPNSNWQRKGVCLFPVQAAI